MSARDLLLELGTEELPPKTLQILSGALTDGMVNGLRDAGLAHRNAHGFATPRRLAVLIRACAEGTPDRRIERRGLPSGSAVHVTMKEFLRGGRGPMPAVHADRRPGIEIQSSKQARDASSTLSRRWLPAAPGACRAAGRSSSTTLSTTVDQGNRPRR